MYMVVYRDLWLRLLIELALPLVLPGPTSWFTQWKNTQTGRQLPAAAPHP